MNRSHLGATAVGPIGRRGAVCGPPGVVMAMVVLVAVPTWVMRPQVTLVMRK